MTEAEARSRIVVFADGDADPALSPADLDVLVSMCRTMDEFGVPPGGVNWTETYNVNYGIAQAWLLKAGRLANRYLFMSGGKMFSRQQFYDHCMRMYHKYAMRSGIRGSRLGPEEDTLGTIPLNVNRI